VRFFIFFVICVWNVRFFIFFVICVIHRSSFGDIFEFKMFNFIYNSVEGVIIICDNFFVNYFLSDICVVIIFFVGGYG